MKMLTRLSLTSLFLFLIIPFVSGQTTRIEHTPIRHEKTTVDALTVTVKPERKDMQKAFDDWIDDRYDINMKGGGLFSDKNTRRAEAVLIPGVSPDNITLFTDTKEENGETIMTIFASRGLGNYIRKEDYAAFTGLENLFDSFLSSYLPEYYEEKVTEAEEALRDLRDEYSDTEEDIVKNEEKIAKIKEENTEKRKLLLDLEQQIADAERLLQQRRASREKVNGQVAGKRRD